MAMTSEELYHDPGQADGVYHFKILVPSIAAGAIIGKKGGIIAQLQEETGAKVKMSKVKDFYPGTTERVCLITGSVEAILRLHEFIMLKIIEKPDPAAKMAIDFDNKRPVERSKQVKILVPNSTAAMIIGRCGSFIKQIKEESGAYIQISQNNKGNIVLAERCITVIGEMENNKIACHMILTKISKDPNSGSCSFISYADVTGPVPNFEPVGSPFAKNPNLDPTVADSFQGIQTGAAHPEIVPFTGIGVNRPPLPLNRSPMPSTNIPHVIKTVKTMLLANGYSEHAAIEITEAMRTLANYGLLGLDLSILIGGPMFNNFGMPNSATNCPISSSDMANQNVYASVTGGLGVENTSNSFVASDPMNYSNVFSPTDIFKREISEAGFGQGFISPPTSFSSSQFLEQTERTAFKSFCQTSPTLASPTAAALPVNVNSFGLESCSDPFSLKKHSSSDYSTSAIMKIDIQIGENIMGAVFGPEGKAITDISRFTGANIRVSNEGEYAAGTFNRIVTVSGDSTAVNIAKYLIERLVVQESKRAQQSYIQLPH